MRPPGHAVAGRRRSYPSRIQVERAATQGAAGRVGSLPRRGRRRAGAGSELPAEPGGPSISVGRVVMIKINNNNNKRNGASARRLSVGRRFAAALLPRLFGTNPMSHHKGGFEPETNGFQFYAIANLDKTSLYRDSRFSRGYILGLTLY